MFVFKAHRVDAKNWGCNAAKQQLQSHEVVFIVTLYIKREVFFAGMERVALALGFRVANNLNPLKNRLGACEYEPPLVQGNHLLFSSAFAHLSSRGQVPSAGG
jgi:hypothetical protein